MTAPCTDDIKTVYSYEGKYPVVPPLQETTQVSPPKQREVRVMSSLYFSFEGGGGFYVKKTIRPWGSQRPLYSLKPDWLSPSTLFPFQWPSAA
jgi:hypothetical protein